MAWAALLGAGVLEIVWAVGLKFTDGWTQLKPSLVVIAAMAVSFFLLSHSFRHIPVGTAYAVFTGIGAAGTALVGMYWLGEPRTAMRLAAIALIVVGIAMLKVTSETA